MFESFPDVVLKNLTSLVTLEESEERTVLRFLWKVLFGVNVWLVVQVTLLNTDAEVSVMESIRILRKKCTIRFFFTTMVIMILLSCKNIYAQAYVVEFACK